MAWLEATIHGDADHSGPSPMHSRRDALVAASDIVTAVRRLSNRVADDVVTTVGELEVSPGSINVVPAEARLTIDVRSYDDDAVAELVDRVERGSRPLATVKTFRTTSKRFGGSPHRVLAAGEPGGAGRRGAVGEKPIIRPWLAVLARRDVSQRITDAAMIFVPSVDGKTHNEAEYTEWEERGCRRTNLRGGDETVGIPTG